MARIKLIPDDVVFATVLQLLLDQGEKSVTFATVAAATGLAPPTLVQRYGSCAAMMQTALMQAWDGLDALVISAQTTGGKGVQALLKSLLAPVNSARLLGLSLGDPALTERAENWREAVESAIAARLSVNAKAKETAALIFAAWQGRLLWDRAGGKGFRLGDALKRLG
jgi:AcrR family transcriptional regulator